MISRVAASLVLAAGLPALIALNIQDYHAVSNAILPMGPRPGSKLLSLQAAVIKAKKSSAVFNTALWVQHLDRALTAAWDSYIGTRGSERKERVGSKGQASKPAQSTYHVIVKS